VAQLLTTMTVESRTELRGLAARPQRRPEQPHGSSPEKELQNRFPRETWFTILAASLCEPEWPPRQLPPLRQAGAQLDGARRPTNFAWEPKCTSSEVREAAPAAQWLGCGNGNSRGASSGSSHLEPHSRWLAGVHSRHRAQDQRVRRLASY